MVEVAWVARNKRTGKYSSRTGDQKHIYKATMYKSEKNAKEYNPSSYYDYVKVVLAVAQEEPEDVGVNSDVGPDSNVSTTHSVRGPIIEWYTRNRPYIDSYIDSRRGVDQTLYGETLNDWHDRWEEWRDSGFPTDSPTYPI